LAEALPSDTSLSQAAARVAQDTAPGEQVAVVVSGSQAAPELLTALTMLAEQGCRVLTCIAVGRRAPPQELAQARQLEHALTQAGFATLLELP
jgi:aspartokinase